MQVCVSSCVGTCIYVWAYGSQGSRPDLFLCCSMWLLGENLTLGLKPTNCLDPLTVEHLRMLWPLFPSTGLRIACLLLFTHCGVLSAGQPVSVALYRTKPPSRPSWLQLLYLLGSWQPIRRQRGVADSLMSLQNVVVLGHSFHSLSS